MEDFSTQMTCPKCQRTDTPILVVRGTGIASSQVSLQCRSCRSEWTGEQGNGRQAS
jgi:transposase-like protein